MEFDYSSKSNYFWSTRYEFDNSSYVITKSLRYARGPFYESPFGFNTKTHIHASPLRYIF